jgi:hypothetical protein
MACPLSSGKTMIDDPFLRLGNYPQARGTRPDITVIALWLGHESIETTHVYLEVDLATKERALQKLAPLEAPLARFTPDDPLLAFLTSL